MTAQNERVRPAFSEAPATGAATTVVPGILWIRLPLPFRLDHVNVWAMEDDAGWTIVDCGCNTEACRSAWRALFEGMLAARPLARIVVTHGHLDHIGLAGPLVRCRDVPFLITRDEWLTATLRKHEADLEPPSEMAAFLRRHGCDEPTIEQIAGHRRGLAGHVAALPQVFHRIQHCERLRFGGREWQAIVAGGHAPEHASFYCEADRILVAGDQILPRITPSIGVQFNEPEANPLGEYLKSLEVFGGFPDDTLVLPGHGLPFRGLGARADEIAEHHRSRLEQILELAEEPVSAIDLTRTIFARAVAEGQGRLALAETLAHANLLVTDERLTRDSRQDGRILLHRAR